MTGGLREALGLPEINRPEGANGNGEFSQDFRAGLTKLNQDMQVVAVHGAPGEYQTLDSHRQNLIKAYQTANSIGDAAKNGQVMGAVAKIEQQTSDKAAKINAGREEWEKRQPAFDAAVVKIGELEDANHPTAPAFRKVSEAIQVRAKGKDYQNANAAFDQLQPKLNAVVTQNSQPTGTATPAAPTTPAAPNAEKDLQGSCLIKVINNSKAVLTLLEQGHERGDFMKSPETPVQPGATVEFVSIETPNSKDQGCKGFVVWQVGLPGDCTWRIGWDNPEQEKNTTTSTLSGNGAKSYRELDQIGQGDENVPVVFTISGGDGGGITPPITTKTGSLSYSVTDIDSGQPIDAAQVKIGNETKTGAKGTFAKLAVGNQAWEATATEYESQSSNVAVSDGQNTSLSIKLKKKGGHEGRCEGLTILVRDKETGQAIAGAKIKVGDKSSTTSKNGLATVELPVGKHKYEASANDYEPASDNVQVIAGENEELVIELKKKKGGDPTLKVGGVSYVVTDIDTKQPIDAAQVKIGSETKTGAKGTFAKLAVGEQTWQATATGYESKSDKVTVTEGQDKPVTIELKKSPIVESMLGSFSYEVLDAGTNLPIEKAEVTVVGQPTQKGAKGKFDKLTAGDQTWDAKAEGYDPLTKQPVTVPVGGSVHQQIKLKKSPIVESELGSFSYEVLDAGTNLPIEKAEVTVVGQPTQKGAKGKFDKLTAGDQTWDAKAEGYDPLTKQPVTVPVGGSVHQQIKLKKSPIVESELGSFSYEVLDAGTNLPIEKAEVTVVGQPTQKGAKGKFDKLTAGDQTWDAKAEGYDPLTKQPVTVPVGGSVHQQIKLKKSPIVESELGSFSYEVIDAGTKLPIEKAEVTVVGQPTQKGAKGKFDKLTAGDQTWDAKAEGYDPLTKQPVTVPVGGSVHQQIELNKKDETTPTDKFSIFSYVATDADTRLPIDKVEVKVFKKAKKGEKNSFSETKKGAKDSFKLKVDTYNWEAKAEGYKSGNGTAPVIEGQEHHVEIKLTKIPPTQPLKTGTIKYVATDAETGSEIPAVEVRVYKDPKKGEKKSFSKTMKGARNSFTNVPVESYKWEAKAKNYEPNNGTATVIEGQEYPIDIKLKKKKVPDPQPPVKPGSISYVATDAQTNKEIPSAKVSVQLNSDKVTKSGARNSFSKIPVGSYQWEATAEDYEVLHGTATVLEGKDFPLPTKFKKLDPSNVGSISYVATDVMTDKPIETAEVTIGKQARTGSRNSFSNVPKGLLKLKAKAKGYKPTELNVQVEAWPNTNPEVRVKLERVRETGSVIVDVIDSISKKRVDTATVILTSTGPEKEEYNQPATEREFAGVVVGSYNFSVKANGYEESKSGKPFTVKNNATVTHKVQLVPLKDPTTGKRGDNSDALRRINDAYQIMHRANEAYWDSYRNGLVNLAIANPFTSKKGKPSLFSDVLKKVTKKVAKEWISKRLNIPSLMKKLGIAPTLVDKLSELFGVKFDPISTGIDWLVDKALGTKEISIADFARQIAGRIDAGKKAAGQKLHAEKEEVDKLVFNSDSGTAWKIAETLMEEAKKMYDSSRDTASFESMLAKEFSAIVNVVAPGVRLELTMKLKAWSGENWQGGDAWTVVGGDSDAAEKLISRTQLENKLPYQLGNLCRVNLEITQSGDVVKGYWEFTGNPNKPTGSKVKLHQQDMFRTAWEHFKKFYLDRAKEIRAS